jgi:phosphatidate cytidylyltransferase
MLKTRILTALALLAAFIPALFYLPVTLWAGLMMVLFLLALYEWSNLAGLSPRLTQMYLAFSTLLGLAGLYFMYHAGLHPLFYHSITLFMLAAIFWIVVVPIWLAKSWVLKNQWLMMVLGWFLFAALWLALVTAKWLNPWMLLIILSTIWLADTAAYFTGKNFGKHKLAPSISPGKTWEGVWGALLANTVFAVILYYTGAVGTWLIVPALCLITILGVYGDLFESMFKRQAKLKDSGQILPGHGGLLDRIDGVIPALPIAVLMLYVYYFSISFN